MQKKLTITLEEDVYDGLRRVIGPERISRFIEDLVRPHVVEEDMSSAYAEMAADGARESEALAWADALLPDGAECGEVLKVARAEEPITDQAGHLHR